MQKEFTNQHLKKLINDLYNENNISIPEELQKLINKSSRTKYNILYQHYNNIKNQLCDKLINYSEGSDDYEIIDNQKIEISDIVIPTSENKTIDIHNPDTLIVTPKTEIITIDYTNDEIKQLKKENFKLDQQLNNLTFKYKNIKNQFKQFRKLKEIKHINYNSSSSSDDEYIKKIDYNELPNLSSINIINELKKLSRHELKQLYNRYFSNKLSRKLQLNK